MKYIRTEQGIYEEQEAKGGLKYFEVHIGRYYILCRTDKLWNELVIAEADTIEELCDEFVMIRKEENLHTTLRNYSIKDLHLLKDRQKHNFEIYGAIWTSKGLIYVAKMNDRGELELI